MRNTFNTKYFSFIAFAFLLFSCGSDNELPKTRGYFRIGLPDKNYKTLDSIYPFIFKYPSYSIIITDSLRKSEPNWINIHYPQFKATLHLSYKVIDNNLKQYVEDAYSFVNKHIPKATSISESVIVNRKNNVYGLIYKIDGNDAASPYQFYVTDSTKNFVRIALYFSTVPNNDSLLPVIDFIKKDIDVMISSFEWKNHKNLNKTK